MTREEYRLAAYAINARGTKLPQARLTDDQVREIRANPGRLFAWQQAMIFGVHVRTIEKIRTYQTWRHVR